MKKWNANELLESLNKETNIEEIYELYKALLAYSVGLDEITAEADGILDDIIYNDYMENDSITTFVNEELAYITNDKLSNFIINN